MTGVQTFLAGFSFSRGSRAHARADRKGLRKLAKKKRENVRKEIRKNLIMQLKNKGADIELFRDQIDDYMALWDLKEELIRDIIETGLRTPDGKDNASPKQLPIVNRQMLALLKVMGIGTDSVVTGDEDDL